APCVAPTRAGAEGETRAIGGVATAAGARGQGLAARLMEEGIALCDGLPITLGAQAHLEGWYERFGFRRSGPGDVEDGMPDAPLLLPPAADRLEALAARTTPGDWRLGGLLATRPEVIAHVPDGGTEHVA